MLAALLTGLAVAAAVDGGPARPTDASADAAVSGAVVAHADEHDHDAPEAAPDDGDDEPGPDDRDDESGPNDRDDDGGLEDGDGERDDQRVRERRRKRTRIPRLPLANDVLPVANDWSPVLVDGAVGCALGGALPAVGATGGL
ncbi:MAG: hypothetical protein FJ137_21295, partial [Deltaproteobacteria bacterium]|nr:hypothetical protein [Deltaproteobacteria bacterium]